MMFNNITNNIIVMLTIIKIMVDQDYCYEKSRSDTLNSIPKIISNVHKVKFVSVAFVYMQEHQMV